MPHKCGPVTAMRGVGGDRRIDGVAPSGERPHPRLRGQLVGGGHDAAAARAPSWNGTGRAVIAVDSNAAAATRARRRGSTSTSRSTVGRSVMIPSTPRSRSRWISAASSIVHTWTAMPRRWQRRTNRGVTTVIGPRRTGTWAASAPSDHPVTLSTASSHRPAAVHSRSPSARRRERTRRSLNDVRHTRSRASWRLITSTSGRTPESLLQSMLNRASGQSSSSSSSVGIGSVPATRAVASSAAESSETRSGRPHSRDEIRRRGRRRPLRRR